MLFLYWNIGYNVSIALPCSLWYLLVFDCIYVMLQIERGEIRPDDYTHLVCNVDLLTEVTIIKKHLKDNFPSRKKGLSFIYVRDVLDVKFARFRMLLVRFLIS